MSLFLAVSNHKQIFLFNAWSQRGMRKKRGEVQQIFEMTAARQATRWKRSRQRLRSSWGRLRISNAVFAGETFFQLSPYSSCKSTGRCVHGSVRRRRSVPRSDRRTEFAIPIIPRMQGNREESCFAKENTNTRDIWACIRVQQERERQTRA